MPAKWNVKIARNGSSVLHTVYTALLIVVSMYVELPCPAYRTDHQRSSHALSVMGLIVANLASTGVGVVYTAAALIRVFVRSQPDFTVMGSPCRLRFIS